MYHPDWECMPWFPLVIVSTCRCVFSSPLVLPKGVKPAHRPPRSGVSVSLSQAELTHRPAGNGRAGRGPPSGTGCLLRGSSFDSGPVGYRVSGTVFPGFQAGLSASLLCDLRLMTVAPDSERDCMEMGASLEGEHCDFLPPPSSILGRCCGLRVCVPLSL